MVKDEKAGLYKPGHEADGLAAIVRMLREQASQATAASSMPTTPVSTPIARKNEDLSLSQTSVKKKKSKRKNEVNHGSCDTAATM
jgi:hypothetical protein